MYSYGKSPSSKADPARIWTMRVDYSHQRPVAAPPFARFNGKSPFKFTLYRAAIAATQCLYAKGKEVPTGDEINRHRFWVLVGADMAFDFDVAANCIRKASEGRKFSHELKKTPGEYLAYGLALLYLKRYWPELHLRDVLFIEPDGDNDRPDFLLPVLGPKSGKLGLEVRSRGYKASLDKTQLEKLQDKKNGFEATLAVYFHYGEPMDNASSRTGHTNRTRLLVADPEGDFEPQPPIDPLLASLYRYLSITRELGLNFYTRRLEEALKAHLEDREMPGPINEEFPSTAMPGRHPQRKLYPNGRYIGRTFSSLLRDLQEHVTADPRSLRDRGIMLQFLQERLDGRDLGLYSFVGVHEEVLRAIHYARWNTLNDLELPVVDDETIPGDTEIDATDGTVTESKLIEPGTKEGDDIIASLGLSE